MAEILYQGHASFRITTNQGLVVYVDPYVGEGYDVPADVILITHDHFDHSRTELVPKKEDCTLIDNSNARESETEYNIYEIDDLKIEAVPAYNSYHPKGVGVGYLLEFDGRKVYITGDTGNIEEASALADRGLDLVFVPCDGTYTMDLEEAKDFSYKVNANVSVPVHTAPQSGGSEPSLYDPEKAKAYDGKGKMLVRPGENIIL